ncbi:MAG TPA: hypothetical protein VHR41_08835 [Gemmatimonadales bacterium]|nr:hypothetical protein [Gemmatimonadales bacterium]
MRSAVRDVRRRAPAHVVLTAVQVAGLLLVRCPPLLAQAWNTPAALALVGRAVERRLVVQSDSALASYRTRAHGFVFFLAQVGEGLNGPPRLVKADELDVEVYWQAPNRSKQVILGWRDGSFLPTDINYHRDHLGIVTNNFGNVIRIGEGDEVRDVPHPLSPAGLALYDFALGDSLAIRTSRGETLVREVQVRPRSFSRPLVVGTLYLDVATAELVRFRFSFTPSAYLDRQLEDIDIVLENARFEGRFWLPYRQEVEIRRRATWLDFPARGIIRGRWEIQGYDLNPTLPPGIFTGPPIAGLLRPRPSDSTWSEPLEQAIAGVAAPLNRQDMDALRVEVERIAGSRALSGLPSKRLAAGSVSDLIHVNRVQGLTLGFGGVLGSGSSRVQLRPTVAYGTSDHRVTGGIALTVGQGPTQLSLGATRRIRDLSDLPVISPVLNSVLSQEGGRDFGDYVLLNSAELALRQRLDPRSSIGLGLDVEESQSVGVSASPATGTYRANPALGAGTYRVARLEFERASGGVAVRRDLQGRLSLEAGDGPRGYARVSADGRWTASLGGTELEARGYLGVGTDGVPAYRSFVLGGRGTLVAEPFRVYGGRTAALAHLEWRFDTPIPALPLGTFASTGHRMTVAPFLSAGYTARPLSGLPWDASDGVRPVAGVALEWFMRLLRIEAGIGLRDGRFGVTVDVNRDWWGLL